MNLNFDALVQTRGLESRLAALVGVMFALGGCASTPPAPTQALQAAEMAIRSAEQARVADYASPELGEARSHLAASRAAVADEKMVLAEHLAERSRLDAELAIAKAEVARARVVNDEMKKGIETLEQEMQRNTGASP